MTGSDRVIDYVFKVALQPEAVRTAMKVLFWLAKEEVALMTTNCLQLPK